MKTSLRRAIGVAALLCLGAAGRAEEPPPVNVPPPGFKALFNGKEVTGWVEKKQPPEHWSAQDGTLVFDGKGSTLETTEKFSNFVLLVDWKVPPNGNSGVFLRGTTQVEINDADKPPRPIWAGTTGGIYPDKPPLKRAAKPAGEWNHFEITVENGVITVKLNGETTLDKFEKAWGKTESGPIGLQNHGTPLWFRNIFIKLLP